MTIHCLITVKRTERFPNKNRWLFKYSQTWLDKQNEILKKQDILLKIYTVGDRRELPDHIPSDYIHIECNTGSHIGDILFAENIIAPEKDDIMVLAQLTQPVRNINLMTKVINATKTNGLSTVTACKTRNNRWRIIDSHGSWGIHTDFWELQHDGALYSWNPGCVADIFNREAPHNVVINYVGPVIDIDDEEDIPFSLECLDTIFNNYLNQNSSNTFK